MREEGNTQRKKVDLPNIGRNFEIVLGKLLGNIRLRLPTKRGNASRDWI